MKIEKFLEKISQDERVDKITYEKGWGYTVVTKDGYGIINETQENVYVVKHDYFSCKKLKIHNHIRTKKQEEMMFMLNKIVKCDEKVIEKANKKFQFIAAKDYILSLEQNIRFANYDIQKAENKKKSLEISLDSTIQIKEKLEKEVEDGNNN